MTVVAIVTILVCISVGILWRALSRVERENAELWGELIQWRTDYFKRNGGTP